MWWRDPLDYRWLIRTLETRGALSTMKGIIATVGAILSAFRERHPGVTVEWRQFTYEDPSAGLTSGVVDVAFTRRPFVDDGIGFETLFAEPLMVMVPANHRLAQRTEVFAHELLDEPLLGAATTDPVWNAFWELAAHRDGRRAPVVTRSNSLLEELHKAATGVGVVVTVASAPAESRCPGFGWCRSPTPRRTRSPSAGAATTRPRWSARSSTSRARCATLIRN
ncbi:hypothetical protein EBN03_33240 [Nocardia stercoris]|uniref:LysR substrate-binding domain-containing protein n=1 Tax=Nocardia stercoris TaxID=2483361 RepID=A0A3M2KTX1_9NOCA|nr:hypothetical protein EBN03_33240 [Nocardia stercoris]